LHVGARTHVTKPPVDEFAIDSDEERKCRIVSAASASALAPAAPAPLHVCGCYTTCQGICVNAPIAGPRKRFKKEVPPL
jgi:hypothetical protein